MNDKLKSYLRELNELASYQAGYCYNYNYDVEELLPFFKFTINNLGDPFVPSLHKVDSRDFEIEVLEFFAELYKATNWWGYVTAGGTEGNLYAMALAREVFPEAILYASTAAHYSISKAAHLYRMNLESIKTDTHQEMDYNDLYEKLNPKLPVIINCTIGTTFTGAIDQVDRVLDILKLKGIDQFYLHCDGALSGMYTPYLNSELMTFEKPISSICISGHKFIGSPFPCGVVIARQELAQKFSREIEYIGSKDATILGSRNGHSALLLWYAIQKRGHLFADEVKSNLHKANYLAKQLKKHQIHCQLNPYSSIVVFPKPAQNIIDRWQLTIEADKAHFAVMQQHDQGIIDHFIREYIESNASN